MYPSMLKGPGDLFADFSRLQERLDELLGDIREPSSIRAVARQGAFPVLKVGSGQEATEIYAFAPGLDPSAIDVSVEKGLLTISGNRTTGAEDRKESREGKDEITYARERFTGAFRRVVSLPEDADTSKVEAGYRNGVLKLVVPRLEAARPRQIAVNR
jgi:HSP20 family protein